MPKAASNLMPKAATPCAQGCNPLVSRSLADFTEDVCKEYRGCCIGMRFLHPVWFIDEVELADCDYTRRTRATLETPPPARHPHLPVPRLAMGDAPCSGGTSAQ